MRQALKRLATRQHLILLFIFLLNALLVSPVFVPAYHDINPDDEAKYIESGVVLWRGELRDAAWGPFIALVYAPAYALTQHAPYWFFATTGIGHWIIYALLWWSLLTLARRFEPFVHVLVVAGVMAVFAGSTLILTNSSFALFAALSAFALAQVITYRQSRQVQPLWQASMLIGLAMLVRNDGLILFGSFLLIVVSVSIGRRSFPGWRYVLAAVLPFTAIVIGYLIVSTWPNVNFDIGTLKRTYFAFEQGQWVMSGNTDWDDAVLESRRIFGSPEENDHNVFRAILRSPQAYAMRLRVILSSLPEQLLTAYGKRMASMLFILAGAGLWMLIKQKAFGLLCLMALWPLHLLAYFLTFFQPGYLLMPYFLILVLAAVGVNFLLGEQISTHERWGWSVLISGAALYTVFDHKLALLVGILLLAVMLWVGWFLQACYQPRSMTLAVSLMLVLVAGLIVRERFPFPDFAVWGSSAEEKSIVFLQENFPPGSRVAICTHLPAIASRLEPISLPIDDPSFDYKAWLVQEKIAAIYVDACIRQKYPAFLTWVEGETGNALTSLTILDPGSIEILSIR